MKNKVIVKQLETYSKTVPQVLDLLELPRLLEGRRRVVIKPNLVLDSPPPVTTDVRCVEAIAQYCLNHSNAEVIVAEGSGGNDTLKCFKNLGYTEMAERLGIRLVDLDREETCLVHNDQASLYKSFPLPQVLIDTFVISVPVLKEHTITDVTLGLKNMIGICPASEFSGYWSYKKSQVHKYDVAQAIVDINLHCPIGLTLVDGGIGMKGSHLGGRVINPPLCTIIAGQDAVAVDAVASGALGHRWEKIRHIVMSNGVLGSVE